jgi:putrescine transport system substrate-binding protein
MMEMPAKRALAAIGAAATMVLAATVASVPAPAAAQGSRVLNIYNWSNYIAPNTVENFERETGIKVRYDTFDSNEILHAKLVAGKTGYDVVVPSSYWGKIQADGGLLQKIDKSKIPNYKNLDPALMEQLAKLDPGNQFLVPWLWGYTTVGINVDKVKAALGNLPMPDNAWDLVFKPEYISRLKSCGVSFLDSPTEIIPAALHYLGKPAYSNNAADFAGVGPLLRSIRPHVTLFSSSGYINDMAAGSICVALGWSGDMNIARNRAIEAKNGQNIEVLIPKTGGIIFMDTMAIPADAANVDNVHKWIDYILRPQVSADLTNAVFYPSPNKAARPLMKPEIGNNPTVFPPDAAMKNMVAPQALSNDTRRTMTRLYTSFKTGL